MHRHDARSSLAGGLVAGLAGHSQPTGLGATPTLRVDLDGPAVQYRLTTDGDASFETVLHGEPAND